MSRSSLTNPPPPCHDSTDMDCSHLPIDIQTVIQEFLYGDDFFKTVQHNRAQLLHEFKRKTIRMEMDIIKGVIGEDEDEFSDNEDEFNDELYPSDVVSMILNNGSWFSHYDDDYFMIKLFRRHVLDF